MSEATASLGLHIPFQKQRVGSSCSPRSPRIEHTEERVQEEDNNHGNADKEDEEEEFVDTTLLEDIRNAVLASRYSVLILLSLFLIFFYQVSIAPYQVSIDNDDRIVDNMDKLKYVRPVLSRAEIWDIRHNLRSSESTFWLHEPYYDVIKLRHFTHVDNDGNFPLPQIFYDGVVFGLTSKSSHDNEYARQISAREREEFTLERLEKQLQEMDPTPTSIMKRSSQNNETSWVEEGLAVHFSLDDLKRQGRLSSDPVYPWKRATDGILKVARKNRQSYVFTWFPFLFAKPTGNNPATYANVIQSIVPTRTGYHDIKTEVVVWLSAVNYSTALKEEDVVQKPWTDEDHWSAYSTNGLQESGASDL